MTKKELIITLDDLTPESAGALAILGHVNATNEAIETALTAVRKAMLRKEPSISANEILDAVSELSKHFGESCRYDVARNRMWRHLLKRRELTIT